MKVRNESGSSGTWCGQTIADNAEYEIQVAELFKWQNDSTVLADIGSADLIVNDGTNDITDVAEAINYLKGVDSSPRDTDGALITRGKSAKAGWYFQPHAVTMHTSKHGSAGFYNKNKAGTDLGFVTNKIYDADDVEITSQANEALAVKSVFTWEPTFDYELIGAKAFQATAPASDLYLYVVAVPDVAAEYGGSIVFTNGGINFRYVGIGDGLNTDGRTSKFMSYNATYHTNKFQLTFKYGAGLSHSLMLVWELYRG